MSIRWSGGFFRISVVLTILWGGYCIISTGEHLTSDERSMETIQKWCREPVEPIGKPVE